MSKKLKMALCMVEYSEGKKRLDAKAGHLFEIDSEHVARLEKLGAIREPTEAEIALYEKQHKKTAKTAVKTAVKPKGNGGKSNDDGGDGKDDDLV